MSWNSPGIHFHISVSAQLMFTISVCIHVISLKRESGRFSFHFREDFKNVLNIITAYNHNCLSHIFPNNTI